MPSPSDSQQPYGQQPTTFSEALKAQNQSYPGPRVWLCLQCIGERKMREMEGTDPQQLPPVRQAVTLLNGMAVCYEHVQVQRQSPLQIPN